MIDSKISHEEFKTTVNEKKKVWKKWKKKLEWWKTMINWVKIKKICRIKIFYLFLLCIKCLVLVLINTLMINNIQ